MYQLYNNKKKNTYGKSNQDKGMMFLYYFLFILY